MRAGGGGRGAAGALLRVRAALALRRLRPRAAHAERRTVRAQQSPHRQRQVRFELNDRPPSIPFHF